MGNFYTYLLSSLPMLHFGERPPFTSAKLLKLCKELIPEKDFAVLSDLENKGFSKWSDFDTSLRNELVKIRASRKRLDSEKYQRPEGNPQTGLMHVALGAHRNPSLIEAEKILDLARWHFLDEMENGHFFDLDVLIAYVLKLRILERWERVNTVDRKELLGNTLGLAQAHSL